MRWQLGAPGVPARSPKRLRKISWGFILSLGNAGEMRWRGWGGVPLLAVRHRALEQPWGCSRLSSCPPKPTWHLQSMGAPVLVPSPGHTCPHLLVVLVPSSCPTCLLLPLIPSPTTCP